MPIGPLFVRIVPTPCVPGGRAMALVTRDGEFVGGQQSCMVESEVDTIATVTVRFIIDGERIILAANDDPTGGRSIS
jgi:hypothetical protein